MPPLPGVDEARARMLGAVSRLEVEPVGLREARGRILAADIVATRDQPPFPASAMDGYAVRTSDLPARLKLMGESHAGAGFADLLKAGETVRILTGAPVPDGADRVVIQEDVTRDGDHIVFGTAEGGTNIRPRGVDFKDGALLVRKGARLDAVALSLAAAAGMARLPVIRRPRVALFGTGDELVQPGEIPGPHQIFDSNSFGLSALFESWGADVQRARAEADDLNAIADAARAALQNADILVVVGGASVGDRDLAKPALATLGLNLLVEKIAVRPGKPVWFGTTPQGLVLGLPGNPASALVCAHLFLRTILNVMYGAAPGPHLHTAKLRGSLGKNGPREHYLRAALEIDDQGQNWARPFEAQDSSLLSVFSNAECLIRLAANAPALEDGALVEVLPLDRNLF